MAKFDKETVLKHVKNCFNTNPNINRVYVVVDAMAIYLSEKAALSRGLGKPEIFDREDVVAVPFEKDLIQWETKTEAETEPEVEAVKEVKEVKNGKSTKRRKNN